MLGFGYMPSLRSGICLHPFAGARKAAKLPAGDRAHNAQGHAQGCAYRRIKPEKAEFAESGEFIQQPIQSGRKKEDFRRSTHFFLHLAFHVWVHMEVLKIADARYFLN